MNITKKHLMEMIESAMDDMIGDEGSPGGAVDTKQELRQSLINLSKEVGSMNLQAGEIELWNGISQQLLTFIDQANGEALLKRLAAVIQQQLPQDSGM